MTTPELPIWNKAIFILEGSLILKQKYYFSVCFKKRRIQTQKISLLRASLLSHGKPSCLLCWQIR